jgi:hypothetical protein
MVKISNRTITDKEVEERLKNVKAEGTLTNEQLEGEQKFIKDPKKKAGRPKKIVMESSSSESEEEKPKPKKKVGRPKKVVESSSSESEEEKPKKKPVGRPKKCSCGSGLDVEPAYKKFFTALKENTTLK